MIFAHTLDKVLAGQKRQTRRLVKPGETFEEAAGTVKQNRRTLYQIGKTYAVQPNRGKPSAARIQLNGLRKETVAAIMDADAKAEGFDSRDEFISTWKHIHGKMADLQREVWVLEFTLCATE
jgi:hypothetical protein